MELKKESEFNLLSNSFAFIKITQAFGLFYTENIPVFCCLSSPAPCKSHMQAYHS